MSKYPHYLERLEAATKKYWDKAALNNIGGETFTYGQMATSIARFHTLFENAGILKGDPRQLMNIDITLTLNEDGTGVLDYAGTDESMRWYRSEEDGLLYYGPGPGEPGMLLTPMADGFLMYGSEESGYVVCSRDSAATWSPEAEAPAGNNAGQTDYRDKKYVCTQVVSGGVAQDAESLGGEYSIVFHEDGMADLTLAGYTTKDLPWTEEEDALVVDYYSTPLRFVFSGSGFELNYFDVMEMTFATQD